MKRDIDKKINSPTIITILGVTGDLSSRQVIPSLFDLYRSGFLPKKLKVIGFSRRDLGKESFQSFVLDIINKDKHYDDKIGSDFISHFTYQKGMFDEEGAFQGLKGKIDEAEMESGICMDKLFYLAVPPRYFETIFTSLHNFGLSRPCSHKMGWTRILVEKPFGRDMKTAIKLDKMLGKLFREEQIFRIDHYLAKENLQNILAFRFSNLIFEPIWNNKYIEKVEIKLLENFGIEKRGSFYDGIGALRDVGQNHMLQMLALVAMENPGQVTAEAIRKKREEILRRLRPINRKRISTHAIRGQYRGYKKEDGVDEKSETETYFKLKAFVESGKWKDVPFYLESGKALKETRTEIIVHFKKVVPCFCKIPHTEHDHKNIVHFMIKPGEGINIRFWAKEPGLGTDIEPMDFEFKYKESPISDHDAYQKVLLDCMRGDQTLFADTSEVQAAWKFITPILENWENIELHQYDKGSYGPRADL